MTITDRLGRTVDGTDSSARPADPNPGLAIKTPCRAATTANITLAGLQTIDGIVLIDAERVLVKNQTDATLNGIYNASSGNWTRAKDWDGAHEIGRGTQVLVTGGTANALRTYSITSSDPLSIGSTAVTITELAPGPELAALAALATTGLMVRAGVTSYTTRSIVGTANEITVANGSGVSANPTLSLPSALTFTGKTVTGGTFSGITLTASDNALTLQDNVDPTKQLQFQLSGISPATTRTLTIPDASGTLALTSNKLSAFAATTSAELASTISDETGTGALVFANSPTLVTPALGTPSAVILTNATGTAAGLTAGHVTTNANLTGDVTSVGNATTLAAGNAGNLNSGTLLAARMPALTGDVTTSAGAVATAIGATKVTSAMLNADVFSTAHSWAGQQTFVAPILGAASSTSETITGTGGAGFVQLLNQSSAPSTPTSATRLFADASNRLSWKGTNGFVRTFDGTANTADRVYVLPDAAGTVALTANNLSAFASTTSAQLAGVLSDETGSGKAVFGTDPTFSAGITVTNNVGAGTFNNVIITTPASTAILTLGAGKTFSVNNTLTLSGTDASTLNIGAGGTLGSNAFTSTAYAPLASPALTGTPTAPTAAVDTNTTQLATTAMVLGQAASATPLIDGTAAVGTSTRYARGDHVHPTDTTRAPLVSPSFTTPSLGVAAATSINKMAITTPATSSTLAVADGKTATISNTLTFTGTDGSSVAFGSGGTVLYSGGSYVSSIAGNTGAFTLSGGLTNSTNAIKRAYNEAVLQAAPADPGTTTSTAGLMMGLGGTCTLTPANSTRVRISFRGNYYNLSNTNSVSMTLRYGTGAAPANGAAASGTAVGAAMFGEVTAAGNGLRFGGFGGIITGLTPGTAYWFDIQLAVFTAGTVGLQNLSFEAMEI
jgi:hypothetical protein